MEKTVQKINLGCGAQIVDGWINVDYSVGAKMAKIPFFSAINRVLKIFSTEWDKRIFLHDLRKPFPWADSTADVIYSSHTLEHLSREDGLNFLKESFRVLKPGGVIRILVPDLAVTVSHYLCGKTRADHFVEGLGVLYSPGKSAFKGFLAPLIEYPHKCHYDAPTLIAILNEIGFQAASMKAFESRISDIKTIELEDRTENAIVIEGLKIFAHAPKAEKTAQSADISLAA
jgi:SAM-dependent methyltransferase